MKCYNEKCGNYNGNAVYHCCIIKRIEECNNYMSQVSALQADLKVANRALELACESLPLKCPDEKLWDKCDYTHVHDCIDDDRYFLKCAYNYFITKAKEE